MRKPNALIYVLLVVMVPTLDLWAIAWGHPLLGWIAAGTFLTVFTTVMGRRIVGVWLGVLIDDRNVISLSRFQMAAWTAVVLSALLTAALYNIYIGVDEPLAIQIPRELWLAMGISTTSLVGTPLLLSQKAEKDPSPGTLEATKLELKAQGIDPQGTKNVGKVIGNTSPTLAMWSDMFTGDETSNGAHIDLAKVQMFFFTIVVVFSYCAALWRAFMHAQADGITAFPPLDESTIALMAISHTGYLLNKAVPRS